MRKGKQILALMLAAVMTLGGTAMTSYAADKKITSVSIEVKADIQQGTRIDTSELTVNTPSNKYSVSDAEFINDSFEWGEQDTPTVQVRLEAASGYYFSVNSKDIKLKGATYHSAKREDSTHLLLTVNLPPLNETAGRIDQAGWESETLAKWSAAANAGNYEVKLYRDGVNVKLTQIAKTNELDMGPGMTKAGTYNYKVRAVNKIKENNKSEWVESSNITVSNELASRMREKYGNLTSGLTEPGQMSGSDVQPAGWIQDGKGWWYRNENGSYATNDWQQINNKWYYFDSKGYMVTGWVLWKDKWYYCDQADGHMLTSASTPDNNRVDSSGVWIQ